LIDDYQEQRKNAMSPTDWIILLIAGADLLLLFQIVEGHRR
jgi:hypothetical protein